MSHATFSSLDLDAFCGLDGLGLTATGQRIEPGQAVLECRVLEFFISVIDDLVPNLDLSWSW